MADKSASFTIAAVQAAPVFFDREKSVEKALRLIEEAADKGAAVIGFPELFIAGHSNLWYFAKGRRLIEANRLLLIQLHRRLQQPRRPQSIDIDSVHRIVERHADMALSRQIVDFIRLSPPDNFVQAVGVGQISVMNPDAPQLMQSIDPSIPGPAQPPDDSVNRVPFFEQQFTKIRPILPGDPRHQSTPPLSPQHIASLRFHTRHRPQAPQLKQIHKSLKGEFGHSQPDGPTVPVAESSGARHAFRAGEGLTAE